MKLKVIRSRSLHAAIASASSNLQDGLRCVVEHVLVSRWRLGDVPRAHRVAIDEAYAIVRRQGQTDDLDLQQALDVRSIPGRSTTRLSYNG